MFGKGIKIVQGLVMEARQMKLQKVVEFVSVLMACTRSGNLGAKPFQTYLSFCKHYAWTPMSERNFSRLFSKAKSLGFVSEKNIVCGYKKLWKEFNVEGNKQVTINISKFTQETLLSMSKCEIRMAIESQINAILEKAPRGLRRFIESKGKTYEAMYKQLRIMSNTEDLGASALSNYINEYFGSDEEKHVNFDVTLSVSSIAKRLGYKGKSGGQKLIKRLIEEGFITSTNRGTVELDGVFIDPIYVESKKVKDGLAVKFGKGNTQYRADLKTGQVSKRMCNVVNPF